jgi:perosamine synthetase
MRRVIRWAEPDIGEEEAEAVKEALKSTWISGLGPQVAEFEDLIRRKMGVKYAIAVNNGTSALLCALQAFREKLGPLHILVPTLTYLATVNTASEIGKSVSLADCSRDTWNIDKLNAEQQLNLVIPVDIAGSPVDYDDLKSANLPIIADSAQAIGARYKGKLVGSQADIHIFSFHAAKTITAGEGGLITTNNSELYELMKSISNQGYPSSIKDTWNYYYERRGFNYRMPNLQAALVLAQLKKLDHYLKARAERAKIYKEVLGDTVGYQKTLKEATHPYFIFGILIDADKQQAFCREMASRGIGTKITFVPAHKLPFYHTLGSYPNSEWVWHHVVSLPIHNKMSDEDVIYVAETTREVLSEC